MSIAINTLLVLNTPLFGPVLPLVINQDEIVTAWPGLTDAKDQPLTSLRLTSGQLVRVVGPDAVTLWNVLTNWKAAHPYEHLDRREAEADAAAS